MPIQSFIIKHRGLATWFMSSRKAAFWEKVGEKKALKMFHDTADRVPAYKKLLQEHNINPETIQTMDDFKKRNTL